jgi:hypothetical protein
MKHLNEAVEMTCINNVYCESGSAVIAEPKPKHRYTIKELLATVPKDPRFTPEYITELSIITNEDLIEIEREVNEIIEEMQLQYLILFAGHGRNTPYLIKKFAEIEELKQELEQINQIILLRSI